MRDEIWFCSSQCNHAVDWEPSQGGPGLSCGVDQLWGGLLGEGLWVWGSRSHWESSFMWNWSKAAPVQLRELRAGKVKHASTAWLAKWTLGIAWRRPTASKWRHCLRGSGGLQEGTKLCCACGCVQTKKTMTKGQDGGGYNCLGLLGERYQGRTRLGPSLRMQEYK